MRRFLPMAKTLVLDATPLIYLSKIGFWKEAGILGCKLATTPQVIEELMLDETNFAEGASIAVLLQTGKLSVKGDAGAEIEKIKGLSPADSSVVLLAKELGAIAVLDDSPARNFARALGVKTIHSTALLIEAVHKKAISAQAAIAYLNEMVSNGWYCDVSAYKNIVEAIKEAAKTK